MIGEPEAACGIEDDVVWREKLLPVALRVENVDLAGRDVDALMRPPLWSGGVWPGIMRPLTMFISKLPPLLQQ